MKKRISTRVICLLIAASVLVGALTVSALNGSPYENLKSAAFNVLFLENMTYESEFFMSIDGDVQEHTAMSGMITSEGTMTTSINMNGRDSFSFNNGELTLSTMFTWRNTEEAWYIARRNTWRNDDFTSLGMSAFGVEDRSSARMRFAELAVDLVVGDLKNNLVMSNQGDGIRRVSGAITESQLPEIVRVLIDMVMEEQYASEVRRNRVRSDFENMLDVPPRRVTIDRIQGHADINSDDIIVYMRGSVVMTIENMFGEVYTMEVGGHIRFTDIGTSVLESPIPGAVELFTASFVTGNFGHEGAQVFFMLNEDGTIDMDSLTTRWPDAW